MKVTTITSVMAAADTMKALEDLPAASCLTYLGRVFGNLEILFEASD